MSDRDRRVPRTPPSGVRAQTAAPVGAQSWDSDVTPLPTDPAAALERVDRRVKVTGQAQLDRVDLLRSDVNLRIDGLATGLMELAAATATLGGKLDVILADRAVEQREISAVRVESARAEIEIRKTGAFASIEETKARRAHWRLVSLKALAAVGVVWAVLSTTLLSRGCIQAPAPSMGAPSGSSATGR